MFEEGQGKWVRGNISAQMNKKKKSKHHHLIWKGVSDKDVVRSSSPASSFNLKDIIVALRAENAVASDYIFH